MMNTPSVERASSASKIAAVALILAAGYIAYPIVELIAATPFDSIAVLRRTLAALGLIIGATFLWRGAIRQGWAIAFLGIAVALAYDATRGAASGDSIDIFYLLADAALLIAAIVLWWRDWGAAFAVILLAIATQLVVGGASLISVGGSWYYLLAGVALLASSVLLLLRSPWAARIYGMFLIATAAWAVTEAGIDLWALVPRIVPLSVLGLAFLMPWVRRAIDPNAQPIFGNWRNRMITAGIAVAVVVVSGVSQRVTFEELPPRAGPVKAPDAPLDWQNYGNTKAGTRYARLDEINTATVANLKEVWHVRTGRGGVLKATPLQVGGLLYVCTAGNVILALDADSGEKRWEFDPEVKVPSNSTFANTCRSVSYHKAPDSYHGDCVERIMMATTDARMFAVDAQTGERCASFGAQTGTMGEISLLPGMGEVKRGFYFVTSPPTVARNLAIVGGWVADNIEVGEPSGVVRAFNVYTGKFVWAWDMGRPGVHTEPGPGEHYTRGTPNVWSIGSYDDKLGLIYLPTGNATPDYFGAHRSEYSEKYSSSVVALDVETGEAKWSFQTVHHDIWDYDVPSQPALVDLPQSDGSILPALVQGTKRGELFLLDRRDGKPISAVEERPVPQGAVPGDWTSKTQPFSVGLPNFREPDWSETRMWGLTPIDQMWCRTEFRKLRYEGHFTPPSTQGTLQFPGNAGGFNWGALAVDEDRQLLVAEPLISGNRLQLYPRDALPKGVRSNQLGTPYAMTTRPFMSPLDVPCFQPPFGRLAVIDLQTRRLLWSRPLGTTNESGPWGTRLGVPLPMGVPLTAGPLITKGGLIFVAGTMDKYIRAMDVLTGEELWRKSLPGTAQATPMSYFAPKSKRQLVVLTVPNATRRFGIQQAGDDDRDKLDPEGGHVIAYALH